MIPWVREKFAESRVRWQNRKQRNESCLHQTTTATTTAAQQTVTVASTITSTTETIATVPIISSPATVSISVLSTTSQQLPLTRSAYNAITDNKYFKELSSFNNPRPKTQSNENGGYLHQTLSASHQVLDQPSTNYYECQGQIWHGNTATTPYALAIPHINLRIFSYCGAKLLLCVPLTVTGVDVKHEAIHEFRLKNQLSNNGQCLNCDTDNLIELSKYYKLTRISKLHGTFDEKISLAAANVQNNEDMLLSKRTGFVASNRTTTPSNNTLTTNFLSGDSDSDEGNELLSAAPTQKDIDLATANIALKHFKTPAIVNIDELVLQSDVQYDIRKILISLANSCAYVIGAGPYASRIIFMLKQRLIQKRRHESDTQQCLIDMGFSRSKVQHALHITNNIYAAALEWLIENQSPTNLTLCDEHSPAMTLSSKFTNNHSIKEKIESLLEIIRIYCQRDVPPSSDMIQLIIDMGFDEATAREALKATKNHQSYACEWLVGNRNKIHQAEQIDGLPMDSPILKSLLGSPHVQLSLSSPKMFIAYLSILEDYSSMSMWLSDNETSGIIGHILRTYHEEKHILAINQFSASQ